jgi:hypothetical protein
MGWASYWAIFSQTRLVTLSAMHFSKNVSDWRQKSWRCHFSALDTIGLEKHWADLFITVL